jgi:C-terminal processing protease CtpA/Prc
MIHEPCNSNGKPTIHIKFDSDDDSESATSFTSFEISQPTITSKVAQTNLIECSLVKIGHEKSFGFEIKGDSKHPGGHFLDSIEIGSPAHRAGIHKFDKILKLNSVDVKNMNTIQLISVMEREVGKMQRKISLVIERTPGARVSEQKASLFKMEASHNDDQETSSGSDDESTQSSTGISQIKKRLKCMQFYSFKA